MLPAGTLLLATDPQSEARRITSRLSPAVDRAAGRACQAFVEAARKGQATSHHLRAAADSLETLFGHMDETGVTRDLAPLIASARFEPQDLARLRAGGVAIADDVGARLLARTVDENRLRSQVAAHGNSAVHAGSVALMRVMATHLDKSRGGYVASNGLPFLKLADYDDPWYGADGYGTNFAYIDAWVALGSWWDDGSGGALNPDTGLPLSFWDSSKGVYTGNLGLPQWGPATWCFIGASTLLYWGWVLAVAGIATAGLTWGPLVLATILFAVCPG